MDFDEFTGTVQHRLGLPGTGEAVRAIRATLSTLGERIPAEDAEDLAASLPMEVKWYVTGAVAEHGRRFAWREFVERVADVEGCEPADAAYHAQVIVGLVAQQVPASDLRQLRDQLPESEDDENWQKLFAAVDAGSWGDASDGTPAAESGTDSSDSARRVDQRTAATFEVYEDRVGDWHWRLVHDNGRIIADGGEGYASRQRCEQGIGSVKENAPAAEIATVEDPTGGY